MLRRYLILLAAVVVCLTPWGAARAQTLPTLSIDSPSVTEPETGTATLTYTVSLSAESEQTVTVDYADAGTGTATPDVDYVAIVPGTLTFAPRETSQEIHVTVNGDDLDEDEHQTIIVTLSNPVHATIAPGGSEGTGTIIDSDPLPTISGTWGTITESNFSIGLGIAFDSSTMRSEKPVSVKYEDAGTGTATKGDDYDSIPAGNPIAGTISIPPGEDKGSVQNAYQLLQDTEIEDDETIVIRFFDPENATFGEPWYNSQGCIIRSDGLHCILTVIDDDNPMPKIDLLVYPERYPEHWGPGPVRVRARMGGTVRLPTDTAITVAVEATDYATVDDFTLTIPAGKYLSGSVTFTLAVVDDAVHKGDETITVSGTASSGQTVNAATITILDDDPPRSPQKVSPPPPPPRTVTLELSPASISENNGVSTVTATLSRPASQATTVTVSAVAQSPAVPDDLTLSDNKTLTIAADETTSTGTVTITGVDNAMDAPDKHVTVSGTASRGLPVNAATLTLTDDDDAAITVTSPTGLTTTEAGGTATFTVELTSQPTAAVRIGVASSDTPEGTVSPSSLTFTPSTWATAQIVTVTGQDDAVDDGDQEYTITLAVAVSADTKYDGMDPDDVVVTNADDDVPADRIVLSVAPARVAEAGGAQSVEVTAAFPPGSALLLTDTLVTLSVTGTTASAEDVAAVADFPVIIPRLALRGTAPFVLTPVVDVLMEGDETVTVSGMAAGFTVTGAEVTIVDDVRGATQARTVVNRAIPPQVTQAMAASTVTAVQSRLDPGTACGGRGPSYNVASHRSLAGIMQTVSDELRDGRLPVERLLGGSSFVVPLHATDDGPQTGWRRLTVWGSGEYRHLGGGGEAVDWDGALFSGHLGVDTCLQADLLVGLAASVSQGAFDYAGLSGATPIGGSYTSRMKSVHPYVQWASPAGLELWGTLGYGWGEIVIAEHGAPQAESSDTTMRTAAVGANGRGLSVAGLLPGGTTRLRLKAEALLTTIKVEGDGGAIEPLALEARRVRLAVEGAHEHPLASGARLVPAVEVGVRHDGGDGVEGTGLEIGGGLRYVDRTRGLTVAGRGRALVTYGAQAYREWGANLVIRLEPGADGRGLSFTVRPAYGPAASGVSRLWEQGGTGVGPAGPEAAGRLEAVVGYGLPALGGNGLLTPYSAVTLERAGHRLRLGGTLGVRASFTVSLEGTREVRRETPAVYGVRLQANRRF